MDANELAERILVQRAAWDEYAQEQQHEMYRLVNLHGTVKDPVSPGFFILDRTHRLMQGLCRLDRAYTLHQTRVLQEMIAKLPEWVKTNPDDLKWR